MKTWEQPKVEVLDVKMTENRDGFVLYSNPDTPIGNS